MKAGWEIKRIGDICKTSSGGTPLKIHKDYYEGGNIPWLLSGEVSQMNIFSSKNFITQKGFDNSSAKLFPRDTVLVAMYGANAGQVGILRFESATNQAVCGIFPNKRIITEFLYHYLFLKQENLAAQAVGGAQPNISQAKIKDTIIPVPPLPEQRRIVAILDEAFVDIAAAKEKAEQNLKNAKEVFASCLESVFSQRGEGWNEMILKEISSSFGRGKSKHRPRNDQKLYGGKYPFIQTGDIRNANHIITDYSQTYNENGLTQSKMWPKGTICITIAANIAETAILNFDACFPDSVIGIVVNQKKSDSDYVEFLLQAFKKRIQAMSKGSAQENINLGTFETTHFPFPTVDKQREIVKYLKDIDQETNNLELLYQQKLSNLQELKKSLLQQAFSGAD